MAARVRKRECVLAIGERLLPYLLSRVPRRRHIQVRIDADGVLDVRVPYHCPHELAEDVLRRHQAWAFDALAKARQGVACRGSLRQGSALPYLGQVLELSTQAGQRGRVWRTAGRLVVAGPSLDPPRLESLVEGWYRSDARRHFSQRIAALRLGLDVTPGRLSVRDQRTRWGSCSSRGNISLNWRLMLLASELVDYVVAHELCHLVHMNHSQAFWRTLEQVIPEWRGLRRRLGKIHPAGLRLAPTRHG